MKQILVVDDNKDIVTSVQKIIEKLGFQSIKADSGKSFLKKLEKSKPDLVLLDVMMPGLTTKEILDELVSKKSKLKIILLTVVRFSEEEIKQLMKNGLIVDYVTKPFSIDDLMKTIKKHI